MPLFSQTPMILTWIRIAFIPLMVLSFYWQSPWASLVTSTIFGVAGLTDWADGYVARRWQLESKFGAFLDPVADKLIVSIALILLVEREASFWMTAAAAIIIARELIISALREWMAQRHLTKTVAVSMLGKLKTALQIPAIIFLLYNDKLFGIIPCREIGIASLIIAVILTVYSMWDYLSKAFKQNPVLNKMDD